MSLEGLAMKTNRIFNLALFLASSIGLVFTTIATTETHPATMNSHIDGLTYIKDKSNTGEEDSEFNVNDDQVVSFLAASSQLYGYAIPGTWLRIVGTQDNTYVRVINLDDGSNIKENMDLDRYEIWNVYPLPGTYFKVEASNRVLGYESDFISQWGHTTFIPSMNSGPVGQEFIFYYFRSEASRFYIFAIEDAIVNVYDKSDNQIVSREINAGDYWELTLTNAVYRITSTGLVAMETVAGNGYTTVPAANGTGVGSLFYFATDGDFRGSFAVFAYQNSDIDVYDLNSDLLLYSQHINQGEYWMQTDVGTQQLRLESTGMVEVWAGDNEDFGIEGLGDDISFAGGYGSQEFYLHSLRDGSVFFAPFDDTQIDVDGSKYELDKDEFFHLEGCCYFRHVISNKPILIQTLGRDSSWNDTGTYLGGVLEDEWMLPFPRVYLPCILRDFCPDFFDDFSNPNSGWDVVDDDYEHTEYLNDEYRVITKKSGFFYIYLAPTCSHRNYIVEVDVRWATKPAHSYGIIFGVLGDFSQYYLFDMNTDFQEFRVLRKYPGGFSEVVPITFSSAINGGTSKNHLKVTRDGNQITLEINGTVLGTWSDGTIKGSTFTGIVTSPYDDEPISDARFDNFALTTLPGSSAAILSSHGVSSSPAGAEIPIKNLIIVPEADDRWFSQYDE